MTPSSLKNEDTAHIIQPVIAFKRIAKADAAAIVPAVASPIYQRKIETPIKLIVNKPFRIFRPKSIIVYKRISLAKV